jgi:hypothetical protein
MSPLFSFDEDGHPQGTVDFDYDAIDRNAFHVEPEKEAEVSAENLEAAARAFRQLVEWMWQDGMKNDEGLKLRAIIVCWVFLDHLNPVSLTELARAFGKKKQSLGRWVDDFKRVFPKLRNGHMKD